MASSISVTINPGETALTVTPIFATSNLARTGDEEDQEYER